MERLLVAGQHHLAVVFGGNVFHARQSVAVGAVTALGGGEIGRVKLVFHRVFDHDDRHFLLDVDVGVDSRRSAATCAVANCFSFSAFLKEKSMM